jgi:GNAT superfamily N-acetyltransferase
MNLTIRLLESRDIEPIAAAFHVLGWNKPASQYENYLAQQLEGTRTIYVAFVDDQFTGYLTIRWQPDYAYFREQNMPEIQDFNVLPIFRRQGIGGVLMDHAESTVAQRSDSVGIGVGLLPDYGAAQRLYVKRGYIPDGRGIAYHDQSVKWGQQVAVDDDLVLYFTKVLK